MNLIVGLLFSVSASGAAAFWIGCLYFSAKYRKPHMYLEVKNMAKNGNIGAKWLIFVLHFSIASVVALGVLWTYKGYVGRGSDIYNLSLNTDTPSGCC